MRMKLELETMCAGRTHWGVAVCRLLGAATILFVYPVVLDDPARGLKNLPFLSPAMLDDVHYAQAEGRSLGLRIDVTLCSGWPYGGPATTLAEAAGRLRTVQVLVSPGETAVPTPPLTDGDSLIAASVVNGSPSHWNPVTSHSLKPTPAGITVTPSDTPRVVLFFIASHTRQKVKRAAVGAEGYVLDLSLIHISEPTRQAETSY